MPSLFDNFKITYIDSPHGPITNAHNLAKQLGFANPGQAVLHHVWWEYKFKLNPKGTKGAPAYWVTEPGAYQLILAATKNPSAVAFHRWVIERVLPGIKQQGLFNQ